MDLTYIQDVLRGAPSFRLKQIKEVVYKDLIEDWSQATTLPLNLREELKKICPLSINAKTFFSEDRRTIKALITLKDNLKIESVLMRYGEPSDPDNLPNGKEGRNTICVSSQVGCPLGCQFCATGKIGFKRNLEIFEIVEQVIFFSRHLKKTKERISNVVFMGMGEPFLNYNNVLGAIRILNDKEGFNLGIRRFSISTVGIIEGIKKLSSEKAEINLAISLHAPNDKLRSLIMPINKKYSVGEVLDAVDDYVKKTHRRVMFEYIMIKDLNDSEKEARQLAEIMKNPLFLVNLISYNPTGTFQPSSQERIKRFKGVLEKEGIRVTQRYRFGRDIKAACGQLAAKDKC
ncbi:MAG: 23S rRNA (adenine(2503)-C(2))-methyltransferase RlmN [Patescibacteria group bacterium]